MMSDKEVSASSDQVYNMYSLDLSKKSHPQCRAE